MSERNFFLTPFLEINLKIRHTSCFFNTLKIKILFETFYILFSIQTLLSNGF